MRFVFFASVYRLDWLLRQGKEYIFRELGGQKNLIANPLKMRD